MSQSTPPPSAVRALPVVATAAEAYARVLLHLGRVARAAALPFALSVLLTGLGLGLLHYPLASVLVALASLVPYTLFGVSWHRTTLLGAAVAPPPLLPAWKRRHWRFLGYLAAVILIAYGVILVLSLAGHALLSLGGAKGPGPAAEVALAVAVVLCILYILLRLSFVFPAVSVDESYGLQLSWIHTRGQGLRLFGAMLLIVVPLVLLGWIKTIAVDGALLGGLAMETGDAMPTPERIAAWASAHALPLMVSELVNAAIGYLGMALTLSVASIAFRTCTGWVPAAAPPPRSP